MNKISIVVPFYNVELYFEQFLNSLLPLDKHYEIFLVDDGSLDNSRNIANSFVVANDNVYLLTKENGGLSSARNFGLQYATGDFILFFDSDDYIESKEVIEKMVELAKGSSADIVVAPYYEFHDLGYKKMRYDKVFKENELLGLNDRLNSLFSNSVSFAVWNKLYRRDFLLANDLYFKEGIWFEDLDFVFRAFYYANKIVKVDNVLIGYRQRDGSIMKSISPKVLDKIAVMDNLFLFLEREGRLDQYYEGFKILYLRMSFSVLYSIVKLSDSKADRNQLINLVFDNDLFVRFIKERLVLMNLFSKPEKLFYLLLKSRVLNSKTLSILSIFIK